MKLTIGERELRGDYSHWPITAERGDVKASATVRFGGVEAAVGQGGEAYAVARALKQISRELGIRLNDIIDEFRAELLALVGEIKQ